jgi:hypothetical protein
MGMFDMFITKPAETPATPAPATPGNIPATVDPNALAAPGTPATPVVPAIPDSPLDQFKTLWEPVPTKEGEVPSGPVPLDPAKLQEIISKADFTKTLNPENLAAISAGGEGATKAFTDSLNLVAQQVLMQSTMAANQMTEHAISAALANQAATIPNMIKSQSLSNNLNSNPIFTNPAVTPIMEAVKAQLLAKNPDATAAQLTEMTQNFVTVLGEAFTPKVAAPEGSDTFNWDAFLK